MESKDLRESFIRFFEERGHVRQPSSPLVSDDPTVLLTTAGMQQFIPYFTGDRDAPHKRYTSAQKCFRTVDVEEVGDTSHLTFFEMLGNFSIGDYFKAEAIKWAWEYLTNVLKLPADKLWVTYFEGEPKRGVDPDKEAHDLWKSIGLPADHIRGFGSDTNFWGPPGESGPCGPSSEIHIDLGVERSSKPHDHECGPNCDCGRFLELWNLVFMQYFCAEDGSLSALPSKNIDTGAGFERLLMVVQGKNTIFETDLFVPIIKKVEQLSNKEYKENEKSFRIIADHVRGAVFLIADGVRPGKSGREYILRRVIRRAVNYEHQLGIRTHRLEDLAEVVVNLYESAYPELRSQLGLIKDVLIDEEQRFRKTIERGLKHFENISAGGDVISGADIFYIYETFGFPIELSREIAREKGTTIDERGLEQALKEHQELSRVGAMEKFKRKGGGQGDEVKKAHTATHLLHQALRDVLGGHVTQAGSRLFDDELSFDFTHPTKMTDEQKQKVEEIVNQKIKLDLPMLTEIVTPDEAKAKGAIGLFEKKYGDKVQICSVMEGDQAYSREFCGGPHVHNTAEIQQFKIVKEKSSSAGIRRIKAVVGRKAAR